MTTIDITHLRTWIGKARVDEDVIRARHARLMAATVDHPHPDRIRDGEPLPPLWHWIYFLEGLPPGELGRDGHPARGGFLPPVPLANRMWAGGRLAFLAPLPIGETVRKQSSILAVDHKTGKAGARVFVTGVHEIKSRAGALLVRALDAAGFVEVRWCPHGESDLEVFRGLERHDRCPDTPDLPHVLIVEARKGEPQAERLNELEALFRQELERYL